MPGFPIISYTITVVLTNYSDREDFINVDTFNITVNSWEHNYQHNMTGVGINEDCYTINFSVMANNLIGSGEYSSIQYSNYIGKFYNLSLMNTINTSSYRFGGNWKY